MALLKKHTHLTIEDVYPAHIDTDKITFPNGAITGTSFQYLGQPIPTLEGRLVAAPSFRKMLALSQKSFVIGGLHIPSPLKCTRDGLTNNVRI